MADPEKDPLLQQAVDVNPPPGPTGFGAVADQTPHKVIYTREIYKIDEDGNRYITEDVQYPGNNTFTCFIKTTTQKPFLNNGSKI